MSVYAIIIDHGYGTNSQGCVPRKYIAATTAFQARKAWKKMAAGSFEAESFVARKVPSMDDAAADLSAEGILNQ